MKINNKVLIVFLQLVLVAGVIAKSDTKCGTITSLEPFRLGVKLLRPSSGPKYVYSTHFIIHFDTTGSGSCTRAYAESTSKYAEYSWAKEVDTLEWAAPPPDGSNGGDSRYDIYITNIPYLGVTIGESWYSDPYPDGATSYIEVDNSITPFPGELQVTVAHEFNHACQFRYSAVEDNFWYENCATWMEDICYDNVNDYVNYLLYSTPNPLDSTYLPITTETNLYWYAGGLWPMFLQEYFGDSCPRKGWERMGTVSGSNTLSGIDYALSNYFSSDLTNALKKYGVWRYFTGTRADITYHFSESNLWPTASLLATHNSYPASGNQGTRPPSGPGGTDFIRFNPGSGVLNITFDGQNGYDWGTFAIGYRVPLQSVEQEISLNANDSGSTFMSWAGNSHIALIPVVTFWSGSANNLSFTYNAEEQSLVDVGVTGILAPNGTIDSGTVVTPQARVKNFGTSSATFPVTFQIGTFYSDTQNVNNLAGGDSFLVNFSDWTVLQRGAQTTRCTTALTSDLNPSNDTMSGSVLVQVRDVACLTILAPTGTIDSGATVTPVAQVKNNGTQSATFSLTFRIGTFYTDTRSKTLNAGITDTTGFSPWQANQIGTYSTRCTTALSGDLVPGNNAVSDSVRVQFGVIADVGVTQILAPINTVDSGTVITPQAMVKNFGNTQQSFPVLFRIGTFYSDGQNVTNLNIGDSILVTFSPWQAMPRGRYPVKCTTALAGDINPTNNALSDSVLVQVSDVGVTRIIAPFGALDSGTVVVPQTRIKNFGTTIVSFPVNFQVGSFYTNLQNIPTLNPSESTLVNFAPCTLAQAGIQPTWCTTGLNNDQNSSNDTLSGSVTVFTRDVGVVQILAPTGTIGPGSAVLPSAKVANFGVYTENFLIYFRIISTDTVYYDSTIVTIEPDRDSSIDFTVWNAIPGSYKAFVRTILAGDQIPENDTASNRFFVSEVGWQPMVNGPSAPSGKNPKNGTCITGLNGKIYLLKSNNTSDFYSYTTSPSVGFWTTLDAIPLGTKETGDGRNPKKGAALTAFNDAIYALRGNNKPGFWSYQESSSPKWQKLTNIPTGAKNPKGGSGIVYVNKTGSDYIFAIKGSKTSEFYLYDITGNTWQPVASPGLGLSGRPGYKDGSCLAYDGDSLVYVIKGNYGDFFEYNVIRNTWTELRRLDPAGYRNRDGKKKKVKDGAGLVFLNGAVYLLKSGSTLEFWKYDIGVNNWFQMNPANIWDIPIGGGKKVKSGGALCVMDNCFYALKGNNTAEFYKHTQPADEITSVTNPTTSGTQAQKSVLNTDFKLSIVPNPTTNITTVKYELPVAGSVSIRLYNCYGALVKSYTNSNPTLNGILRVDLKTLSSGIYILGFSSGSRTVTKKLVVKK
jgi:hypothetical protein